MTDPAKDGPGDQSDGPMLDLEHGIRAQLRRNIEGTAWGYLYYEHVCSDGNPGYDVIPLEPAKHSRGSAYALSVAALPSLRPPWFHSKRGMGAGLMLALWLRFWDHLLGIVRCSGCGCAIWEDDLDTTWRYLCGWRCPGCAQEHLKGTVT